MNPATRGRTGRARRRSPLRIVLVLALAALVLAVTSHPQPALWVAAAAAVYAVVEGVLRWRRRA
ncbi:hypothetical protein [Sinomonas flava]|uniref:hypothetical protein n=1 Tax=Sinomonas flava TaxID=496857 RepID=UPI0039A5984C